MEHPEDRDLKGIVHDFFERMKRSVKYTKNNDSLRNMFCTGMVVSNYCAYLQKQCSLLSDAIDGDKSSPEDLQSLNKKLRENTEAFEVNIMSSFEDDLVKGAENE